MSNPNKINKALLAVLGIKAQEHFKQITIYIQPGRLPLVTIQLDNASIPLKTFKLVKNDET